MTKFGHRGDVTHGFGSGPRSVAVFTENQAGFDSFVAKLGVEYNEAVLRLERTVGRLNNPGSDIEDIHNNARTFFLTGARPSDKEMRKIRNIVALTLNGLRSGPLAFKIHQAIAMPRPNWAAYVSHGAVDPAAEPRPWNTYVAERAVGTREGAVRVKRNAALERRGAIHLRHNKIKHLILIHEATHKYAGTIDYRYMDSQDGTPPEDFTDKAQALINADSYAWFVHHVGDGFLDSLEYVDT